MKKYLNKQFAKKLLIMGGIMYAVSLVLNFVTVYSVYGKVDECLDKTANCTLSTEQIVGKIAMAISYTAIGIFFVGLVLLLTVMAKKKKR